ncbi:MAG: hypothetical protein Ta2F_06140 [Termitinemataceae bacterium]|nr:MAG: hypothetical protein Ta2F_06140 [Termitinemataceae bacterium]
MKNVLIDARQCALGLLIAVLFVLSTTQVIAEDEESPASFNIGGYFLSGVSLLGGKSDSSILTVGPNGHAAPIAMGRINATGQTAGGKFGAFVRFDTRINGSPPNANLLVRGWWKPNSVFKLHLGNVDLGATNAIVGWGFFASGLDDSVATWSKPSAGAYSGSAYTTGEATVWYGFMRGTPAFYVGPDDKLGFALELTPVEGLALSAFAPVLGTDGFNAKEVYQHAMGQVAYTFKKAGTLSLSYASGRGSTVKDPGKAYAAFNLTAVENLGLNIGASYTLPVRGYGSNASYKDIDSPVAIGLGTYYKFNNVFTLKARLISTFAGSEKIYTTAGTETNKKTNNDPANFGIEFLPIISAGAGFNMLLDLGFTVSGDDDDPLTDFLTWHFSPMIQKSVGPASFFAGLQIQDNGKLNSIAWAVPIGLEISF